LLCSKGSARFQSASLSNPTPMRPETPNNALQPTRLRVCQHPPVLPCGQEAFASWPLAPLESACAPTAFARTGRAAPACG
jgi:hypothetical protein